MELRDIGGRRTSRSASGTRAHRYGRSTELCRVQFEHGQCVTTRFAKARLQLDKKGPSEAVLADTLTYELTVTNIGEAEAAAVKLTDALPPGLEAASGTSPLTWDLGAIAPGQSRHVQYQVIAKSSGRLCDRASAVAAGGLHAEAESCVTVGEPRLTLTKVGPARRYLNSDAVYQITATNAGTVPLSNVTITDSLPANVVFVRASNGSQRSGNEVSWSIGTLRPAPGKGSRWPSAPGNRARYATAPSRERGVGSRPKQKLVQSSSACRHCCWKSWTPRIR